MNYLKAFVIGSSYLVFLPYFYAVKNNQSSKNYSYYHYTLVAPLWFGIWNILSLLLANYFNLSKRQRFFSTSVISSITIMLIAYYFKAYNYTNEEWCNYFLYIFIKYIIVWNLVIFNLDKYI